MNKKPYMTMEEIISIPRLSRPAVSEDGSQLAWVESVPNWDKNEYRKHLQVYDVKANRTTAITAGNGQSNSPAWSPHGRLAWLSSVGEGEDKVNQVFVRTSGQPLQVTHDPGGVTSFRWSPQGCGLYFLAPDRERREELKKRKDKYGHLEFFNQDYVWASLYYQDLLTGIQQGQATLTSPKDLRQEKDPSLHLAGDMNRHILSFDISPDNTRILMLTAPTPNLEDGERACLLMLDIATGTIQQLPTTLPLNDYGRILFSPDGNHVAYTHPINEGKWGLDITTLEILDLTTNQTSQPLLDLDECIYPLRWTQKGLLFSWQHKTDWYVGILTAEGHRPLQDVPGSVTMEAAVSHDGTQLATLTATRQLPVELYLNGAAVTNQSSHYQGKTLSNKEVISWQSQDGTTIEGVLITPPEFPQHSPLLVIVHGGPTWVAFATPTDDHYYPYEQFVERGFIILDVNYRGSSGYGSAFRRLNFRNLGIGDYEDVISGVDMLVQKGMADRDRVGIMGWSQGGYISAMCSTYSDRFKAISAGAGISSWYTYYTNTDIPHFTRHYLGNTPWNDPEVYARTSPMTYIRQACTPTLIQHGDGDSRVPYANSRELYRGLMDMGVPVELVTFKGMGHNPTRPGLHRAIMHQNYTWFCHHLLGDSLDDLWLLPSLQDKRPEG